MLEVLIPISYLVHPKPPFTLMMRAGAKILNNVEYYRTARMDLIKDWFDIKNIIEKNSIPLNESVLMEHDTISVWSSMAKEKCSASFDFLKNLGTQAIVCEGAGQYLPV